MKTTGIVRKLDQLGRVVIPKELRKNLAWDIDDPIEFYVQGELVVMRKYTPACMFCGETNDVIVYNGKKICKKCLKEINRRAKDE